MCASGCTDLKTDHDNCGSCGQVCMGTCSSGPCQNSAGQGGGGCCSVGAGGAPRGLLSALALLGAFLIRLRRRGRYGH